MKFSVNMVNNIICEGCGGTTRVAPSKVYNTDDLTCNCADTIGDEFPLEVILAAVKVIDEQPSIEDKKEVKPREHPNQKKFFEDDPEHVVNPDEVMEESEVREYLEGLKWQELLTAAKNNGVTKPPSTKADGLIELIIAKVFHE